MLLYLIAIVGIGFLVLSSGEFLKGINILKGKSAIEMAAGTLANLYPPSAPRTECRMSCLDNSLSNLLVVGGAR